MFAGTMAMYAAILCAMKPRASRTRSVAVDPLNQMRHAPYMNKVMRMHALRCTRRVMPSHSFRTPVLMSFASARGGAPDSGVRADMRRYGRLGDALAVPGDFACSGPLPSFSSRVLPLKLTASGNDASEGAAAVISVNT